MAIDSTMRTFGDEDHTEDKYILGEEQRSDEDQTRAKAALDAQAANYYAREQHSDEDLTKTKSILDAEAAQCYARERRRRLRGRWCEWLCDVYLCSLTYRSLRSASALVTFSARCVSKSHH
jgi:hypothetical protein